MSDPNQNTIDKLAELVAAIQEATQALRTAPRPTPTPPRPDTIESRIVGAVQAHGRVSFADLGILLAEPKQRIHHHAHAVALRPRAPIVILKRPSPDGRIGGYVLVAYDARHFPADIDALGPWGVARPARPAESESVDSDDDDVLIP